jgi:hypothetical protein
MHQFSQLGRNFGIQHEIEHYNANIEAVKSSVCFKVILQVLDSMSLAKLV